MPDSNIVDTRKFTNKNKRTAPKMNGASGIKGANIRSVCESN